MSDNQIIKFKTFQNLKIRKTLMKISQANQILIINKLKIQMMKYNNRKTLLNFLKTIK